MAETFTTELPDEKTQQEMDEAKKIGEQLAEKGISVFAVGKVKLSEGGKPVVEAVTSGSGGKLIDAKDEEIGSVIKATMLGEITKVQTKNFDDYISKVASVETPLSINLSVSKTELAQASAGAVNVGNILTK